MHLEAHLEVFLPVDELCMYSCIIQAIGSRRASCDEHRASFYFPEVVIIGYLLSENRTAGLLLLSEMAPPRSVARSFDCDLRIAARQSLAMIKRDCRAKLLWDHLRFNMRLPLRADI